MTIVINDTIFELTKTQYPEQILSKPNFPMLK